jgi:hypothetical protein
LTQTGLSPSLIDALRKAHSITSSAMARTPAVNASTEACLDVGMGDAEAAHAALDAFAQDLWGGK